MIILQIAEEIKRFVTSTFSTESDPVVQVWGKMQKTDDKTTFQGPKSVVWDHDLKLEYQELGLPLNNNRMTGFFLVCRHVTQTELHCGNRVARYDIKAFSQLPQLVVTWEIMDNFFFWNMSGGNYSWNNSSYSS